MATNKKRLCLVARNRGLIMLIPYRMNDQRLFTKVKSFEVYELLKQIVGTYRTFKTSCASPSLSWVNK